MEKNKIAAVWDKIRGAYERKAKVLLKDEGALRKVIAGARAWLEKQKNLPFMKGTVEEMIGVIDLLTAYVDGKYRCVPKRMLVAMIAGLLYVVSPINLIPDWIPVLGWLDDIAVFSMVMDMGVSAEIKKFRAWEEEQNKPREISDETIEYVGVLSKLKLDTNEKEIARKDLAEMLDYIDKLGEADTEGVEPMTDICRKSNCFREDDVTNGDQRERILANAPKEKDGAFVVPRTFD